jgi:hypothetical protein
MVRVDLPRDARAQVLVVWFGAFPEGAEDWGLARQVLARHGPVGCCAPPGRRERQWSPPSPHTLSGLPYEVTLCTPSVARLLPPHAPV